MKILKSNCCDSELKRFEGDNYECRGCGQILEDSQIHEEDEEPLCLTCFGTPCECEHEEEESDIFRDDNWCIPPDLECQ